jgi:hypothetical protein
MTLPDAILHARGYVMGTWAGEAIHKLADEAERVPALEAELAASRAMSLRLEGCLHDAIKALEALRPQRDTP